MSRGLVVGIEGVSYGGGFVRRHDEWKHLVRMYCEVLGKWLKL